MIEYSVGRPFPHKFPEGVLTFDCSGHLDLWDEGIMFNIFIKEPTNKEIRAIQYGEIRIALSVMEGVIFLVFIFCDKTGKEILVIEAPYTVYLSKKLDRFPPKEKSISMMIILVNIENKLIETMRVCILSQQFSETLLRTIKENALKVPLVKAEYDQLVYQLFSKWNANDFIKNRIAEEVVCSS